MLKRKQKEIASDDGIEKKCIDGLLLLKMDSTTIQIYKNYETIEVCCENELTSSSISSLDSISSGVSNNESIPPTINNLSSDCNNRSSLSLISVEESKASEEYRLKIIEEQSQRLSLLRHASKCPHLNNACPVTPFCWAVKTLWSHMMTCKDQQCNVKHCLSSRYILAHYSNCISASCPVCDLVRSQIKRNYERNFARKKLKAGDTPI
jgi:hypothetical protein